MHQQPNETTGGIEWFAANLPSDYLSHPQYFLYSTALETEALEDTEENRRRFKAALTEHQLSKGIPLPEAKQEELTAFMESGDGTAQTKRASAVLTLTARCLKQTGDLATARRMAVQELFERESPLRIAPMDESYFCNRELVERDLRTALEYTNGKNLIDLSTNNPNANTKITTQTGENITWGTYLDRVSAVLLNTKQHSDNPPNKQGALKLLQKLCDVIFMDEKYFNNLIYIKHDLEDALLKARDCTSIIDLNTGNPGSTIKITTYNGENITWGTYLNRVSAVFFGTKDSRGSSNKHKRKDALDLLKKNCRVILMDKEYFGNLEYVRADLMEAVRLAECNSIKDLNTDIPNQSTVIATRNGESIVWATYLIRVSVALFGTKQRSNNPHKTLDALNYLKEYCGVILMNENYFRNPRYVKADLECVIKISKRWHSIKEIGVDNFSEKITAQNGEFITWIAYLNRASKYILGTDGGRKSTDPHRKAEVLAKLKQIAAQDDEPTAKPLQQPN